VVSIPTATLSVADFQHKWQGVTLKERSASQTHFNDLCHMLGVPTPTDADPTGPDGFKHLLPFKGRPNFCQ
jgi:hypothetical protein